MEEIGMAGIWEHVNHTNFGADHQSGAEIRSWGWGSA